jgi:cytochrome b561
MTLAAGQPRDGEAVRRYAVAAIILHWTIAGLITLQLCLGWYMNEVLSDKSPGRAGIVGLHISVGLTILVLVVARICARLAWRAQRLPAAMPAWERILARATHVLFYLLMLVMPLTGWAIVSLRKPTTSFWGLPWPAIPGLEGLADAAHKATRESLSHFHVFVLVWILVLTLALHVAGALWHQFRGPTVLWRMGVGRRPGGLGG